MPSKLRTGPQLYEWKIHKAGRAMVYRIMNVPFQIGGRVRILIWEGISIALDTGKHGNSIIRNIFAVTQRKLAKIRQNTARRRRRKFAVPAVYAGRSVMLTTKTELH
jgi:hypothetical protein